MSEMTAQDVAEMREAASRMVRKLPREEQEDAASEVCVRTLESWDGERPVSRFVTGVARNVVREFYRNRAREEQPEPGRNGRVNRRAADY